MLVSILSKEYLSLIVLGAASSSSLLRSKWKVISGSDSMSSDRQNRRPAWQAHTVQRFGTRLRRNQVVHWNLTTTAPNIFPESYAQHHMISMLRVYKDSTTQLRSSFRCTDLHATKFTHPWQWGSSTDLPFQHQRYRQYVKYDMTRSSVGWSWSLIPMSSTGIGLQMPMSV